MDYYPYYEYGHGGLAEAGSMAGITLAVVLVFYLLAFGFSILVYILQALGTYTIAMRRGINHPWLAWVPFGNLWILGSISDQYQYVAQGRIKNRRKILVGLQIALVVLLLAFMVFAVYCVFQGTVGAALPKSMGIMALGMLAFYVVLMVLAILLSVFQYICLYNLFASCDPNSKVGYLLLCIFISVTMPFLVFSCRKKDYGMPPRRTEPAPCAPMDPPTFEG